MEDSPLSMLLFSDAGPWLAALWGALWGSFANVVIERLPRGESVMRPASHCLACGATIRWYDNVPLLSFVLLRGRCRRCGARFSARYALVEAIGVLLGLLCFHHAVTLGTGSPALRLAQFIVSHLFATGLVAIVFIDLNTMIIPDAISLPLLLLFAPASVALGRVTWQEAVLGAAAGFVPVWLLRALWLRLRGVEGIGLGDAKLLAAVGGVLGWQALPAVVLLGSVQGLLVAVPLRLMGRSLLAAHPYQGTAVREMGAGAGPASPGDQVDAQGEVPEPAEAASAPEEPGQPRPEQQAASSAVTPSPEAPDALADPEVEYDEVPEGAVPFGPFLALAAIEVLFWGASLNERFGGILDRLLGPA